MPTFYFLFLRVFNCFDWTHSKWNTPPANRFSHFLHSQIAFSFLFAVPLQNGQFCFIRCFFSTAISFCLTFPYPAPNLPAAPIFFFFTAIFVFCNCLLRWDLSHDLHLVTDFLFSVTRSESFAPDVELRSNLCGSYGTTQI